jgi:hypothetical protein
MEFRKLSAVFGDATDAAQAVSQRSAASLETATPMCTAVCIVEKEKGSITNHRKCMCAMHQQLQKMHTSTIVSTPKFYLPLGRA